MWEKKPLYEEYIYRGQVKKLRCFLGTHLYLVITDPAVYTQRLMTTGLTEDQGQQYIDEKHLLLYFNVMHENLIK